MNIIKTKKQMFLVIGAFALVLFLGTVTYAFFSYTREGSNNLAQTGRISFTSQESPRINLSDAFPISSSNINNDTDNVGSVTIHVTGDTTYDDGVEYLVRAINVSNTITSGNSTKDLPISINVSVGSITTGEAPNQTTTTLGTADDSYFTNRGSTTSVYKVLKEAGTPISNGENLLVGYIAKGATGVNGNIIIKAYIDADNILISDTDTVQGKTVFTTSEWNSLDTEGVSFRVTVIAQEGVWVTAPTPALPTMTEMCPGCKFMWTTITYYYDANNTYSKPVSTLSDMQTNNETLVDDYTLLNKAHFLGVKLNSTTGEIEHAYSCGIKGDAPNNGTPFCIEGKMDGSAYATNMEYLNPIFGLYDSGTGKGCEEDVTFNLCHGAVEANATSFGLAYVGIPGSYCTVSSDGDLNCY